MSGTPRRRGLRSEEVATLRVPRRIREAVRIIAAFEERAMEEVTLRALESHIRAWESKTGFSCARRPARTNDGVVE